MSYSYTCQRKNMEVGPLRTSITDKTLSYFPFGSTVTKQELITYIKSVQICGADYIEISRETAAVLKGVDFSQKYILRVRELSDIPFARANKFAYVCAPLYYAGYLKGLPADQQIILEVCTDLYSAQAMLLYVKHLGIYQRTSMIRLTGVFCDYYDDMEELIRWYHANFFPPLDLCPVNTMLTGVSDAVKAYMCGADMLTLSFGRGHYFTSLEQFIISIHITKKRTMHSDIIKGICAASLMFSGIFGAIPAGLAQILDTDSESSSAVFDIEKGIMYKPAAPEQKRPAKKYDGILERKIKSIGLEREIEDAIIDMLKKVNFSFYKDITKRNFVG